LKESYRVLNIQNRQGGDPVKQEIPVSIHVSNVMLWDSEKNVAGKIGYKMVDAKKYAISKNLGILFKSNLIKRYFKQ
jgi:ribosomal protein L24